MNDLSIVALAPVIRQPVDSFAETLQTEQESYIITESLGFDQARFTLTGPPDYLLEWYENGLIRDVTWYGPDGSIAWHGYVNRLSLSLGDITRAKSVDAMANRILYVYTSVDATANPPTTGAQATLTKNDTNSQARYGIKAAVISGSQVTDATADDDALAVLKQMRTIKYDQTVSIGEGKQPSLQVEMRGYAHMIDWNFYSQTVSTDTDNAHTIIIAVLAADPNGIANTSAVNINANTMQIEKYQDGKKTGWKIIQEIAARGYETGGTGYVWTVGVYEDRQVWYKAREAVDAYGNPESTNKYLSLAHHIADRGDIYLDQAGREVMSWEIRPDRLVYSAGFPGDPMYVTQVTWTAPGKVTLRGEAAYNPFRAIPAAANRFTAPVSGDSRTVAPDTLSSLDPYFFSRSGDISLQSGRSVYNSSGGEIMVPVGGIILWSGSVASIPTGWALCNGAGGTPDLRDRFVVGAGSTYAVGATGGATTKNLAHTHAAGSYGADSGGAHTHGYGTLATDTAATHTHGYGTLGTDTEAAHTHGYGTLGTDTAATHTHGIGTIVAANAGAHDHGSGTNIENVNHTHGSGTIGTQAYGVALNPCDTATGSDCTAPGTADYAAHTHGVTGSTAIQSTTHVHGIPTENAHTHTMSGSTGSGGGHSHSVTSGLTGSGGGHSHSVTSGSTGSGGGHSHSVTSGSTASGGAHVHTISGTSGSGGSATQDILPPYYALAYIMRTA